MLHSPAAPNDPPRAPLGRSRLTSIPRSAVAALTAAGVDVEAIARRLGAASATERMPEGQTEAILEHALAEVTDGAFGLRSGIRVRPELFGLSGFAAMSAPTYGEALSRIARYKRMCALDRIDLRRVRGGLAAQVVLARPDGPSARLRADAALAFVVGLGQHLTQAPLRPLALRVRGPAPAHEALYREIFGVAPRFQAAIDEVVLSSADLARPLVSHSRELAALFGERADEALAESGGEDDVAPRVRAVLHRTLLGDAPTLGAVARSLGTSDRSLQRRLAAEDTSFARLLDEVRHEIARRRLARSDVDIAELSFLLGFTTTSSFHRAWKRWEGTTPLAYRRSARGEV